MSVEIINGMKVTTLDNGAEIREIYNASVPLTLLELKSAKLQALNAYSNQLWADYLAKFPEAEVASFPDKQLETKLVMADPNTPLASTPVLVKLTDGTIDGRNALALAVDAKLYEVAALEKFSRDTRTAIKDANSQEELEAIKW